MPGFGCGDWVEIIVDGCWFRRRGGNPGGTAAVAVICGLCESIMRSACLERLIGQGCAGFLHESEAGIGGILRNRADFAERGLHGGAAVASSAAAAVHGSAGRRSSWSRSGQPDGWWWW